LECPGPSQKVESSISWMSFKLGSFTNDEILKINISKVYKNEKGRHQVPPLKLK
jgi:hypothetical protein